MPIKYIILEGINGCGKTTIGTGLVNKLKERNISAQFLHFPDESDDLGKVIRKVITNSNFVKEWSITGLLYAAESEMFHKEHKDNDIIYVLDRHSFTSSLIYQKDMKKSVRDEIYHLSLGELKEKAKVFYLDVDGDIAYKRTIKRNSTEKIPENKSKDKFLQNFQEYAERYQSLTRILKEDYNISVDSIKIGEKLPEDIISEIENKIF